MNGERQVQQARNEGEMSKNRKRDKKKRAKSTRSDGEVEGKGRGKREFETATHRIPYISMVKGCGNKVTEVPFS